MEDPRPTHDVDLIVFCQGYTEYAELEKKLAQIGFNPPRLGSNHPICRKEYQGILVDVLPSTGDFLGFNTNWFELAISHKSA